ncbi:MAG: MBOAT family protein [Elusimicrobia bacterium]|nr:MBOAT family protein [Elusimicrobiota bacterium]
MLLIASLIFYGSWNWKFLSLLLFSVITNFYCSLKIYQTSSNLKQKVFLSIGLCSTLLVLGFFKYFNFFADNIQNLANLLHITIPIYYMDSIILPVGISFYTFQIMSYTMDVYRRTIIPVSHLSDLLLYICFFPQLVAGPIERASHLLPQIMSPRKLNRLGIHQGAYLILWGLFQKSFVADNLAKIVQAQFSSQAPYNGAEVLLALYAFSFQILTDFCGYSDIARGLGKCMGFDIMVNFNIPYFSKNPREFWGSWHISLSNWFKDYVYIPLGGNRLGGIRTYKNLLITMGLAGFWHGSSWLFFLWGIYHGLLLVLHRICNSFFHKSFSGNPIYTNLLWRGVKVVFFFHLVCFGWLFFRAGSAAQVYEMLKAMIYNFDLSLPAIRYESVQLIFYSAPLLFMHIIQKMKNNLMVLFDWPPLIRWLVCLSIFYFLLIWGEFNEKEFIYFQF